MQAKSLVNFRPLGFRCEVFHFLLGFGIWVNTFGVDVNGARDDKVDLVDVLRYCGVWGNQFERRQTYQSLLGSRSRKFCDPRHQLVNE